MSFELPNTKKDYYVLTQYPELTVRAKELNIDNFVYYPKDPFDQEVLDAAEEKHKIIVKLKPSMEEKGAMNTVEVISPDSDLCIATFNPWGRFLLDEDDEEGTCISTITEVSKNLLYFVDFIEYLLQINGIAIKCRNCNEMFFPGDKYCKYCGSRRDKGTYLPGIDFGPILYGAPVKKRYKCTSCGNLWVTDIRGSEYCPNCGKTAIKHLNANSFLIRELSDYSGKLQPYDSDKYPVLLSEEQVNKILMERQPILTYDYFCNRPKQEQIYSAMRKAGILDFEKDPEEKYTWTDRGSDIMNLIKTILFTEGHDPYAYKDIKCPHCGSKMIGGICYDIKAGDTIIRNKMHMPSAKDSITYYDDWGYSIDIYLQESLSNRPAWFCLQCGDSFGEFALSKWQLWKFKKALRDIK